MQLFVNKKNISFTQAVIITCLTAATLFVLPVKTKAEENNKVYINEMVQVEANTGGNIININGQEKEINTSEVQVKVRLENIIGHEEPVRLDFFMDEVGERTESLNWQAEDGSAAIKSQVEVKIKGVKDGISQELDSLDNNLDQQENLETNQEQELFGEVNSETQQTEEQLKVSFWTSLGNFFNDLFNSFLSIFS